MTMGAASYLLLSLLSLGSHLREFRVSKVFADDNKKGTYQVQCGTSLEPLDLAFVEGVSEGDFL